MKRKKLKRRVKDTSDVIIRDIAKDFSGLGFLSDEEQLFILPTILPSFNRASLIGGVPGGSIIEFHGPNQGGKTTLGLALLVSAQRAGYFAGILDYEGSFKDKRWPKAIGLNLESCMYLAPKSLEEGADFLNDWILSYKEKQEKNKVFKNKMTFWLIDSVTAMVPESELIGSIGKQNYGLRANLLSRWLSKLNTIIKGTNISVIFVNQERANVGAKAFQKKWKTASGEALKYYAHFRTRVLQASSVKTGEKSIGKAHRFVIEKNKVSAADELGYFFTSNGKYLNCPPLGLDIPRTYLNEAEAQGVLQKSGKTKFECDYNEDTTKGMTQKKLLLLLREDRDFFKWLDAEFKRRHQLEYK